MSEPSHVFVRTPAGTARHVRVGECIYCGTRKGLSDEHIVPYSLGGSVVLDDASCASCAAITSRFEQAVTRGFMHNARIVAGLPSRRRRDRPTHLTFHVKNSGKLEAVTLPVPQAGALMFLPLFAQPALLDGRKRVSGVEVVGYEAISFGKSPAELASSAGAEGLHMPNVTWDVSACARMIAKIAWGFSVMVLAPPLPPRSEVPLIPLILAQTDDASVWLGTMQYSSPLEPEGPLHVVSTQWTPDPERNGAPMFVSHVKLFANSNSSGMGVVVWRPVAADPRIPVRSGMES